MAGLVSSSLLVTLASEMTTLSATVACLSRIWAVLGDVPRPVALVTVVRRAIIHLFSAIACPVARLVAFVASRVIRLSAIF